MLFHITIPEDMPHPEKVPLWMMDSVHIQVLFTLKYSMYFKCFSEFPMKLLCSGFSNIDIFISMRVINVLFI